MKISAFYSSNIKNDHEITGIFDDSRDVCFDSVFFCVEGYLNDGKNFIEEAINKGAKTIIYSGELKKDYSVNLIKVFSVKNEMARLLKEYYNNRKNPFMIGVTGTNGKTTTTSIVYEFLKKLKKKVILFGTSHIKCFNEIEEVINSKNTTPSICTIYNNLYKNDYDYCIMEVSSQGICEGRVNGIDFDIVGLTNISQDHLDYHKTMISYVESKIRFVSRLKYQSTFILSLENNYFKSFIDSTSSKVLTVSSKDKNAFLYGDIINKSIKSMDLIIGFNGINYNLKTNLIGDFNLENINIASSILIVIGFCIEEIVSFIENIQAIEGRMNTYLLEGKQIIVDFAHTPDGVEKVINYAKSLDHKYVRVVMGCGGNRDRLKRKLIGEKLSKADFVYLTEDNSRDESTIDIIDDIKEGIECDNYKIILNRKEAIDEAIYDSNNGDIILILGKGSEKQIIGKRIYEFSDVEYIRSLL